VGLGYWGPNLLRVLSDLPDVDVRWICDTDSDRLERFARRYPGARQTSSVDELFADPGLDAVCIATPVFTHVDLCRRALIADKHTFVEKPLATSIEDADALLDLASERRRVLMCGHTFLYSPAVRSVKDMVSSGRLGEVLFVSSSRVNLGLHQRDISVVWDLGPHDFSILLHWLGELPSMVRAVGRASVVAGIPDVAFVTLEFASGVVASVELSWLAPCKLRRSVVVGSDRMVVYEDGATEPVKLYDSGVVYHDPETFGEYHLSYRTGDMICPRLDGREPLNAELSEFAAAVRSGEPLADRARIARDVVLVTEAVERSLRTGGAAIELPRRTGRFVRSGPGAVA
jgi:predicted dehydrogenase